MWNWFKREKEEEEEEEGEGVGERSPEATIDWLLSIYDCLFGCA